MKNEIEDIVRANWEYDNLEVENISKQIMNLYNPIIKEKMRIAIMKFACTVDEKGLNFTIIDVDNYIKNVVDKEINNNAPTYL